MPLWRTSRELKVLNSLDTGRRLALRIIMWQAIGAVLVGVMLLPWGVRAGLAAVAGALLVMLGTLLHSMRVFVGMQGVGLALGRMLTGMILKWMTIVCGLFVILTQFRLPPLAVVLGLMVACAVNLMAFRFKG